MKRKRRNESRKMPEIFDPEVSRTCGNCGAEGSGKYCSTCGQGFETISRPMREILGDFLGIFSLDGSILRTIMPFLFKPGFLTREYLDGKRKKYMSPIRLYIFLSIIFFFLVRMDIVQTDRHDDRKYVIGSNQDSSLVVTGDSALLEVLRSDSLFYGSEYKDDSIPARDREKSEKIRKSALNAAENQVLFMENLLQNSSYALFILMPVFALILQLLYIRRKRFYVEHLLFSINMHSFALFLLTVMVILKLVFKSAAGYFDNLLFILPVYFTAGMKRFYRQGLVKIILKEIILAFLYAILLTVTLIALVYLTAVRL